MKLSLEVHGQLEAHLTEAARRLGVSPEDIAAAALRDMVSRAESDFDAVVRRILDKNRDLYRRLA